MRCFFSIMFIALLLPAFESQAMSKRPQEKEVTQEEQDAPAPLVYEKRSSATVPATFLDTLNRGKEFSLSEKDFKSVLPDSTDISFEKDGKEVSSDGFRIQCFASSQIERIRSEQKVLESKAKYPIYIVFNTPYYKLLLGDFVKKSDADNALAKLKELGYPDAWVARSRINLGPRN
jgi:hypothetical protein